MQLGSTLAVLWECRVHSAELGPRQFGLLCCLKRHSTVIETMVVYKPTFCTKCRVCCGTAAAAAAAAWAPLNYPRESCPAWPGIVNQDGASQALGADKMDRMKFTGEFHCIEYTRRQSSRTGSQASHPWPAAAPTECSRLLQRQHLLLRQQ